MSKSPEASLRELAGSPAYRDLAPGLVRLADDLGNGDTAPWRGVDLLAFFDAEAVVGQRRGVVAWCARHVDVVRTVLLFLPLLVTWGGIYFAVQAYRELLGAPRAEQEVFADASFLQMWTRGFGDRTWVTLDVVALLDFCAILAVVVFFVGGTLLQRRAAEAEERDRLLKADALRDVLIEAGAAVRRVDDQAVDRLTDSAKELLPVYDETLRRLVDAQKVLADLVDDGRANITELVRATGDLAQTGTVIAGSAKSLEVPTAELATRVREMETVTGAFAAGVQQVNANLPAARDDLLAVVRAVGELHGQLNGIYHARVDDLRSEAAAHSAAVAELAKTREELVVSIEAGKRSLADFADAAKDIAVGGRAIVDSSDGLKSTVESLARSTDRFGDRVDTLVTGAEGLNSRLPAAQQQVLDVLAGIRDVGAKLDDIHARQEVVTQELGVLADNPLAAATAANRTAKLAKETEAVLRTVVADLPAQMEHLRKSVVVALDRELEERRAAAGLVGDSFVRFDESAVKAAQALQRAVDDLRAAPALLLPELHAVSVELADSAQQSRRVVEAMTRVVELDGQVRRRWWRRGSGRAD
ncbi:hypothetical protein [Saccharothrix carnea]|uniref:hypothetical protein n=1 Tax=Saccharothrix carnea TaxID=1280637 RepID=UPI0011B1CB1E|nr:hypothetical protein [Saccharothrix carnea]